MADKELSYFGSDLVFRTATGRRWRVGLRHVPRVVRPLTARRGTGPTARCSTSTRRAPPRRSTPSTPTAASSPCCATPSTRCTRSTARCSSRARRTSRSFEEALAAEDGAPPRAHRVPPGCQKVFGLSYRAIARYHDQVERYLSLFGPERVCVVLYDDLVADAAAVRTAGCSVPRCRSRVARPRSSTSSTPTRSSAAPACAICCATPPGAAPLGRLAVPDEHARAALRRRLHVLEHPRPGAAPMPAELRAPAHRGVRPRGPPPRALLGRDLSAW